MPESSAGSDPVGAAPPVMYVSWGGSGRASSLRAAIVKAHENSASLIYLGVLDDDHFGDIDPSSLKTLIEELAWLLRTQVDTAKKQLGTTSIDSRVLVRFGGLAEVVREAAQSAGLAEVVVGSPVPVEPNESEQAFLSRLQTATGLQVVLV